MGLDDNRILVTGGLDRVGSPMDAAELLAWNGNSGTMEQSLVGGTAASAKMHVKRAYPTCTNLGDGRVLVTGGASSVGGSAEKSAEIYTIRQFN